MAISTRVWHVGSVCDVGVPAFLSFFSFSSSPDILVPFTFSGVQWSWIGSSC